MDWRITEDRPIWMQLSEQIAARITSGVYGPGERLPSVRELAAEAGVNPNTMQRAFAELESRGLVTTNRTAGRSVTQDMERIRAMRAGQAFEEAQQFLGRMRSMGFTRQEIRSVLEEILKSEDGERRENG
ncbi:MAG: GntR family transcriptional regulator [Eubacteriales bacterium]|nr:GntR family transcriptional regulator [Eubacteriales bacterium]